VFPSENASGVPPSTQWTYALIGLPAKPVSGELYAKLMTFAFPKLRMIDGPLRTMDKIEHPDIACLHTNDTESGITRVPFFRPGYMNVVRR
jgi:hypothetical protein